MNSVSVVVPVYNCGPRVGATLDSVLAQTVAPLEILVVDDGSTDGTADWIEANYGVGVRLIRQANQGVAGARNRGFAEARGEFIAFLDHDDLWLPSKLEQQLRAFQDRPNVCVVGCDWVHVDEHNHPLPDDDLRVLKPKFGTPSGYVFPILVRANFIVSMSVPLVRAHALHEVGGFDPQTVPCDDWDVWLRLSQKCEFGWVKAPLVRYVHSPVQQSSDQEKMWRAAHRALAKHRNAVWRQPKILWIIASYGYFLRTLTPWYYAARAAIARGDWPQVRRQVVLCCWRHPLTLFTPQWIYVVKRLVTRDAKPF